MTLREKTVIRILLLVALIVNGRDDDLAKALRDLGNHIAHAKDEP